MTSPVLRCSTGPGLAHDFTSTLTPQDTRLCLPAHPGTRCSSAVVIPGPAASNCRTTSRHEPNEIIHTSQAQLLTTFASLPGNPSKAQAQSPFSLRYASPDTVVSSTWPLLAPSLLSLGPVAVINCFA